MSMPNGQLTFPPPIPFMHLFLVILGSLFLLYCAASWFFLRYPTLIHARVQQPTFKHTIAAHRGGKGEEVESSLSAFKLAVKNGADMLEMDLQMTRDGEIVVFHDDSLARMCGVEQDVEDTDYRDLPPLTTDPTDPHSFCGKATGDPEQTTIPTFEQVLQAAPGLPFVIELKHRGAGKFDRHTEFVEKVATLLCKYDHDMLAVIGSRFEPTHSMLRERLPESFFYYSAPKLLLMVASYWIGWLPFLSLKETFCMTPLEAYVDERFERFIPGGTMISRIMGGFPKIVIRMAHPKLIEHARKRGIHFSVFGDRWGSLNSHEEYKRALDLGLGVCTNYPMRLRQFMQREKGYDHVAIQR